MKNKTDLFTIIASERFARITNRITPTFLAAAIIMMVLDSFLEGLAGPATNPILLLAIPAILLGYWLEPRLLKNTDHETSVFWMFGISQIWIAASLWNASMETAYIAEPLSSVLVAIACGFLTFWTRKLIRYERRIHTKDCQS